MKPYNSKAKCSKCGAKDISTQYHKDDEGRYGDPCYAQAIEKEHHDRHCRNCGYEWCEAVLKPKKGVL